MLSLLLMQVALAEPACELAELLATQPQADRTDVPVNVPIAFQVTGVCGSIGVQLFRGEDFIAEGIPEIDSAGIGRLIPPDGDLQPNSEHRVVMVDEAMREVLTDFTFTTGDRVALVPDTPPVVASFSMGTPEKFGRELVFAAATMELLIADPDGVSSVLIGMTSPVEQPAGLWLSDGSGSITVESEWVLPSDATEVCVRAGRLRGLAEPSLSDEACAPIESIRGCSHAPALGWLALCIPLVFRRRQSRGNRLPEAGF